MTVGQAHEICDELEGAIQADFSEASITIHVEPETEAVMRCSRILTEAGNRLFGYRATRYHPRSLFEHPSPSTREGTCRKPLLTFDVTTAPGPCTTPDYHTRSSNLGLSFVIGRYRH